MMIQQPQMDPYQRLGAYMMNTLNSLNMPVHNYSKNKNSGSINNLNENGNNNPSNNINNFSELNKTNITDASNNAYSLYSIKDLKKVDKPDKAEKSNNETAYLNGKIDKNTQVSKSGDGNKVKDCKT